MVCMYVYTGEVKLAVVAYDKAEQTAKNHKDKQLLQTIAQGRQKIKGQYNIPSG